MKNSEILFLFAQANRKCGYDEYADFLENSVAVKSAEEILSEDRRSNRDQNIGHDLTVIVLIGEQTA